MKVKMHSGCIGQEKVVIGELTPPAPSCRCKKQIEFSEADKLVKRGEASWVIVRTVPVEVDVNCPLCASMSDTEKKTCAQCGGKGKIVEIKQKPDYNNDIVLLSSKSVDPKNKRYRWNMGAKTPRVPTIEAKHISRAIVDNLIYAVKRIKEYASMIQEALAWFGPENRCKLGAQLKDGNTGEIIEVGFSEPPDDWYTQTGRKWDMGRSVLRMADVEVPEAPFVDLIKDRPPYPDPKLATGGGISDKNGNAESLLLNSLEKIKNGEFESTKNGVIAGGIYHKDVSTRRQEIYKEDNRTYLNETCKICGNLMILEPVHGALKFPRRLVCHSENIEQSRLSEQVGLDDWREKLTESLPDWPGGEYL